MKTLLKPLLAALCVFALSTPALAQIGQKAYAPEDLRGLSYDDQVRVIGLEYQEQSGGRRIPDDQLRFYLDQVNHSSWGFSQIKQDIARSLGGGATDPAPGGAIRCESADNRSRTCPTPWRGSSQLSRQLSNTDCQEGRNWSSRNGEVTVWGGCRAEFVADGYAGPGAGTLLCESVDNRSRRCTTPWRGPSRMVRQLSDASCVEGRSWTAQDGQITVWSGCRAEFAQGRGDAAADPIRCESRDNRVSNCRTPWRGHSQLVRQLSETRCREGENWSSGNGQVTVWGGCRGEFARGNGGWNGSNGGNGGGYSVTCSSGNGRYTTCHWAPGQGRPRLLEQLSQQACIEGRTWGQSDRNTIWVDAGCRGRFGN